MFARMQTLPIRYFDTHTHGDIMSCYTNDADTLRQMICAEHSQCRLLGHHGGDSIRLHAPDKHVDDAVVRWSRWCCMFVIIRKVAGKSGSYFIRRQRSIGAMNGYIEEMINGQKVIKVFCHEDAG